MSVVMPVETRAFAIQGRSDAIVAASQARRFALRFGMATRRATELAIVVSELASNIVKHGIRGEIRLAHDPEVPPRGEITIEAHDVGPPIRDLQMAMIDGYDDVGPIDPALLLRRRGIGAGLGAVARLADRLEYRKEEGGKVLTARFLLR
ncbi:MAG TPA: ATP-binding protein [Thermoanaerobaculia bacterium]|nr:ATP-binding protein [Thermoanaerobaculia bacterium]